MRSSIALSATFFCALFVRAAVGQVSASAYRALGQPDLRQNGINMVQGLEMYSPFGVAVDSRGGTLRLFVSDSLNHRVLAWEDARAFQIGDPPALVLGQPSPQHSGPLGIGAKGFNAPMGMAVDPATGNLYVADFGNHRVLRFPNPFANPSRIEPDAVYGQPDFMVRNAATPSRNSLNRPRALAFDGTGNLWVADSGNHRVLRFPTGVLDSATPEADLVVGQKDFTAGAANRGTVVSAAGLETPAGLVFDAQNNLFVSDLNNARVLKFAAPLGPDAAASVVLGQIDAASRVIAAQASAASLAGPAGLAMDRAGNLLVAIPSENRILTFAAGAVSGASATGVLGQVDFTGAQANPSAFPYAAAGTFSAVTDVKTDAEGNLYVADTGNHRVLAFAAGARAAARVFGQVDFSANGINRIKPGSIHAPFKIAVDYSQAPYALYVSDTENHRILGWKDSVRFRTGDPADLVIGQPDFGTALVNIDTRGSQRPSALSLFSPKGIAVDTQGNLYVADSGNHRVLRFPRPVSQSGRIAPDAVIGQVDFNTAVSAAVNASSLRSPASVALGPDGDLFVADSGNHRVLEFAAGAGSRAAAIRVYGQPALTTRMTPGAASPQTLNAPSGIFVDAAHTLYVADTGAHRVLLFPNTKDAPAAGSAAAIVLGQTSFDTAEGAAGATGLRAPADVAVDANGSIYVSDSGNHRILIFQSLLFLPLSGAQATAVVGQRDTNGAAPNWNSTDGLATAQGLFAPRGLFLDRKDTLYVGDTGNNRVLHFLKPSLITHAANSQVGTPLARGGLATLSGSALSEAEEKASGAPLALALANREVVVNDEIRAPLATVSASRVDFQVPSTSPLGSVRLALRTSDTGELVAGVAAPVIGTSPGLFTSGGAVNQDGAANSASSPAARGTLIKLFGTGQGPVSPAVADGDAAPSEPGASTVAVPTSDGQTCLTQQPSVCVAIGGVFGDVQFSGLAPGMVGVWQMTVRLPLNATTGNAVPVRAVINGTPTNIVPVAIR